MHLGDGHRCDAPPTIARLRSRERFRSRLKIPEIVRAGDEMRPRSRSKLQVEGPHVEFDGRCAPIDAMSDLFALKSFGKSLEDACLDGR
jgi:hypothetical protein